MLSAPNKNMRESTLRWLVCSGFAILTLGSLALVGYSSYQHYEHVYAPYSETTARVLQIHSCQGAADVTINFTVNGTSVQSRMTSDTNGATLDLGVDIVYDKEKPQKTWSQPHDVSGPWDAGIVLGIFAALNFIVLGYELHLCIGDRRWPFRFTAAAPRQATPQPIVSV